MVPTSRGGTCLLRHGLKMRIMAISRRARPVGAITKTRKQPQPAGRLRSTRTRRDLASQASPAFRACRRFRFDGLGLQARAARRGPARARRRLGAATRDAGQIFAAAAVLITPRAPDTAAAATAGTIADLGEVPAARLSFAGTTALIALAAALLTPAAVGRRKLREPEGSGQRGQGAAHPAGQHPAARRGRGQGPDEAVKAVIVQGARPFRPVMAVEARRHGDAESPSSVCE
jgi:hypothetical protein